jgi:hypothetical protein
MAYTWLINDAALYSYPSFQQFQRFALATLYHATSGENWFSNAGWLSNENECDWRSQLSVAEICTTEGRYTKISLPANNLVGTLPNELAFMTDLMGLSLPYNALTGSIPSQLASCTDMRIFPFFQIP